MMEAMSTQKNESQIEQIEQIEAISTSGQILWTCPSCKLLLRTASQLAAHISMEHVPAPTVKNSVSALALKCPECPSTYMDSINSLLFHLDTSHGSRSRLLEQNLDNFDRLFVKVHKKHINVVRPAYSGSLNHSVYKNLCDEFDSIRENENLLLLRDEGPPLSSTLAALVEMATPGDSFDLDVPYSCPECAVPISKMDELRDHMKSHSSNAFHKWRFSKIEALKHEMEWRREVNRREKEIDSKPSTSRSNNHLGLTQKEEESSPSTSQSPPILEKLISTSKISPPEDPSTKMTVSSSTSTPSIMSAIISSKIFSGGQLLSNLALLHASDSRKHKRRDLVATNRNARSKPMSAEKLLSLSCMQCGLIFENRCKYTRHLLDHKMESSPYRCPFKGCMMSYDIKQKLRSHVQRKHPEVSESAIELACLQGDAIFAPKSATNITVSTFLKQQRMLVESSKECPTRSTIKEEAVEMDEQRAEENNGVPADLSPLFSEDFPSNVKEEEKEEFSEETPGPISRNGRKRKAPNQFSP